MAKEEAIELEGTVTEVLPDATFRVLVSNGHDVHATIAGKMRRFRIRVLARRFGKRSLTAYTRMQPAMPIGSSAHRGHRSSISGTASPADFESEFARGPFRCTAVAAAPFQFPLTLDAFSYEAHADLDYEVRLDPNDGLVLAVSAPAATPASAT